MGLYLLEVHWESGRWEIDRALYASDDLARVDGIIDEVLSFDNDKVIYHHWLEAEMYDGVWEKGRRA